MESNLVPIEGVPPGVVCIQEGSYDPAELMEDLCSKLNAINDTLDDNPLNISETEIQISLGIDDRYIQQLRNFFSGGGFRFPPDLPTKIPPVIIKPLPISKSQKELIEDIQGRIGEVWPEFIEIMGRGYNSSTLIPNWNDYIELLEETQILREELERLMNELKSHVIELLPRDKNKKDKTPIPILLLCEKDADGNFVYQDQINDAYKEIFKAIKQRLDDNKAAWDKKFKNNTYYNPLIPIPYISGCEFTGKKNEGNKKRQIIGNGPNNIPIITRPFTKEEAPSLFPSDPEDPEFQRPPQLLKPPGE